MKTSHNQYMYADTKQIYNGNYIDIRGKLYAGKRYVVGLSRQIIKIPVIQKSLNMYDYALKHKQFVNKMLIPKIQYIVHPRLYKIDDIVIDIYILENILDNKLMDVKKQSYDNIVALSHPLFKYYTCKLKIAGSDVQKYVYNIKQLSIINNYNVVNFIKNLYQI